MLQGLEVDVPNLESKDGNSNEDKLAHDIVTAELESKSDNFNKDNFSQLTTSTADNLNKEKFSPLTTSTPKHIMLAANDSNGNAESTYSMLIPKLLRETSKLCVFIYFLYFKAMKIIV